MRYVKLLGGVLSGYAIMVILITVVQEGFFGGVDWGVSSLGVLAVAGIGTFLSAVIGSFVGTWIAAGSRVVAHVMSLLVATETVLTTLDGTLDGPLWFIAASSGSLIVGIYLGSILFGRRTLRRPAEA